MATYKTSMVLFWYRWKRFKGRTCSWWPKYKFNDFGIVDIKEKLVVPDDYEFVLAAGTVVRYVKKYKGIDTSDVIVYDNNSSKYETNRNDIKKEELEELDIEHYLNNEKKIIENLSGRNIVQTKKYIHRYNGKLTCILTLDINEDNKLKMLVFNLDDNSDISLNIDLGADVW